MGTSNFYYKNASRVFAICMPWEEPRLDDEGNEIEGETETMYPEREDYEDTRDYIREQMEESKVYSYAERSGRPKNDARSFEGSLIGQWSIDKEYAGVSVEVIITACSRSGYYEGACLDWYIDTYLAGNENDCIDHGDWLYYNDKLNGAMAKIIADKANKWIEKMKDKMSDDLEKLFAKCCGMELTPVATFSNGETMYKQVNKKS